MPLDPAVVELLAAAPEPPAGAAPQTPAEIRAAFDAMVVVPADLPRVRSVTDLAVPGPAGDLRVRLYLPEVAGPVPLFVWMHGGGWTLGGIEENEAANRRVCRDAGVAVASVEYRLAPEDPYPAAPEDCYAVLTWLARNGHRHGVDASRIAVGGESAGGNLATVLTMLSRDRGGPRITAQVLVCPVTAHPADDGLASYADCARGFGMTADSMRFFFRQYPSSPRDLDDPYLLPSRSKDLTGLPPALVLTAEYDVLRSEGEQYADRLARAGVPTTYKQYDGQIHGFYGLYPDLPASPLSHADVVEFLTGVF
ncbi:alpha/beta hydrolase [Actinosynnema sp. NPDC047251]|uniref:Alpha/beta hydrolase fold containing protein n=1 Tax=Saccharothrix espanaensis (strain ATCC 51144 / DSM 44229 / JCM 9112 / NBRC 15066 / NRRL 15764) TaxID=1179773 RepID=K0K428_SACES|nr:alpha/beta hydrolase [Saccharothrix espanaensis]CCH31318.1 alpha/beta hydrolase fold containing protein [Saccharothrix espanaensis DSM 44229]